jgi:hypothetical protein
MARYGSPIANSKLDVLQQGGLVLLVDHTESKLDIVDPATSAITDSVALPPNQPDVFLAGEKVVILEQGTGEVWIVNSSELADFDAQSESTLSLGVDAAVSVDPDGVLFAFSRATQLVYRLDTASPDAVASTQAVNFGTGSGTFTITSVGGRWAILDSRTHELYVDGRTIDLSGIIGSGIGAVLQWPSALGDRVLVGYSGGLLSAPLSGAAPVGLVDGAGGIAARPLMLGDCEFAAWTNGEGWRRCGGGTGTTAQLAGMAANARLAFQTNTNRAVLNDRQSGATWAVQRSGELIDNWDDLIVADDQQPQQQQNQDIPPVVETTQQPPIAVDDAFGARPGASSVLPVLLNDYDPNGDVLVVSDLVPLDEAIGRIDLINERQQIQLTLAPAATGQISFSYTITDGRGGTASATVVVVVRAPGENSPPKQVRSTKATVQSGGRVTTQVLGDWIDPDGDAFYLTSASVASPDAVTYKPQGSVVYSDSGKGGDLKIVTLVVSDGVSEASGSVSVSVKAVGEVPIVADPFVMLAYAGQEITVSPLDHVRGGSGVLRLNSVPAKADVTIAPSYETGTFRFTSDTVRSHYLDYVVTDGTQTVTGVVRIDVAAPPNANTKPITVPKTVFVKTLRNERIDVAGTDVDPAGGVLLVTGIMNLAPKSGVRAEVLEQRLVRVSLDAPLDNGPVTFNYRITNGLADAIGVITVVEIPTPSRVQPPVANDDSAMVRVGEAIDIPVLANDEHPDGLDLTLDATLAEKLPADSGLLFASGKVLRYLAPNKTGNFTASYRVTGPDGQAATARVSIAVREADVATNNAPVPATVTARVIAGETVRVKIPLTGIDPDGDSVQLLGQSSNPEIGAVVDVQSDTIVYQAGEYSAGTDTFSYIVIDSLGARATGTVRIGVSPRLEGARNPVAIVDEVTVRPGVTVNVQVLANDSDPDGSPLTIISAKPNDSVTKAKIVGDVIAVTPPRSPGGYGVIYAIENGTGGTSQNFIRVNVDPNAPLARPVATDTVLTLSDILDRDHVTVDALANVFFADGDPRRLDLSVYSGYGNVARVTSDKRIEVSVGAKSQIIPFKITHPDDASVFTYAFIRVPGHDDALPQLDRRASALTVKSEDQLVIDLNDYVIAVGGKQVRLTDSSTVRATHADGSELVRDADTLVYTSADKYFGPASISFEVTDGTSATDPNGKTAILVLPITVLPRENQPPVFGGAVIDFEPGQDKAIDLLKLTNYPYPKDVGELAYSVLSPLPVGFSYELSGHMLTLRADGDAVKGATTSISIGVRDKVVEGQSGRIDMTIVKSTRPLLKPASDTALTRRGTTTVVDVLANDQATNPFPGKAMTVVDIRGIDGGALPPGVQIEPSADKSKLTATISSSAEPGDVNLQYQVADFTNDPDRYVWGNVTISVQDRPDPVSNLTATSFGDHTVTMRWNAGQFNNSPITNYRVTITRTSGAFVSAVDCPGTTCTVSTPGNGSANAVRVSVVATNAIGDSDSNTSDPVWSDVIPAAPTGLQSDPLDQGLHLTWNTVPDPPGGSPVSGYLVTVGGVTRTVGASTTNVDFYDPSLVNGSLVTYTISARNDAFGPLAAWNSSSQQGTPAGPPLEVAAPLATALSDTVIALDWGGRFNPNGRDISKYTAAIYTGSNPTSCSSNGDVNANGAMIVATGTGTSTQFSGLSPNSQYLMVVWAYNGQGCTVSSEVQAHTAPGVITAISTSGPSQNGEVFDFVLTGGAMGGDNLTGEFSVYYRLNGGSEHGPVSVGDFLQAEPLQYGQVVSVQARACRDYGEGPICQQTLSAPIQLGVPVDPRVTGLRFVSDENFPMNDGTFFWDAWPSGSYEAVQFGCGTNPGGPFTDAGADMSCHVDALPSRTPYLTIRVTANGGKHYDISYNGFDFE